MYRKRRERSRQTTDFGHLCGVGLDEGALGRIVGLREEHLRPTLQVLAVTLLKQESPIRSHLPVPTQQEFGGLPGRASPPTSPPLHQPQTSSSSSSDYAVPRLGTIPQMSALLSDGHFKFWAQVDQQGTGAGRPVSRRVKNPWDSDSSDDEEQLGHVRVHLEEGAVIRLLAYTVSSTAVTDTTPRLTISAWDKLTSLAPSQVIGRPQFFLPEFQRTNTALPSVALQPESGSTSQPTVDGSGMTDHHHLGTPTKRQRFQQQRTPSPSTSFALLFPPDAPRKKALQAVPRTFNLKRPKQLEFGSLEVEKARASVEFLNTEAPLSQQLTQPGSPISSGEADDQKAWTSVGQQAKKSSAQFLFIEDLRPHMANCFVETMVVNRSVVKTWTTSRGRTGKLFWIDLEDVRHSRIRCTVYNSLVDRYYDLFVEGAKFRLHEPIVKPANPKFCTYGTYELSLASKTIVTPLQECAGHLAAPNMEFPLKSTTDTSQQPTQADFEAAADAEYLPWIAIDTC